MKKFKVLTTSFLATSYYKTGCCCVGEGGDFDSYNKACKYVSEFIFKEIDEYIYGNELEELQELYEESGEFSMEEEHVDDDERYISVEFSKTTGIGQVCTASVDEGHWCYTFRIIEI